MYFLSVYVCSCLFFFFKQKTAYEMRISDWSSDVCSSDLMRRDVGCLQFDDGIVLGTRIARQGLPPGNRLFPGGALRRMRLALEILEGLFVRRDQAGAGARLDRPVTDGHAAFHRTAARSEGRLVGTECVVTCRSGESTFH